MMSKIRRMVLLTCTACTLVSTCIASSTEINTKVGIPNPIVTYDTYQELAKKAGFTPLYLTRDSGYSCTNISLIDRDTADLAFQKLGRPSTNVHVRTMLQKQPPTTKDVSGIYGAKWEESVIDGVTVYIAKLDDTSYAAHWTVDDYQFAAQADNINSAEFQALLENSLVQASSHYFIKMVWLF